jgi:hypothetical protein
MRNLITKIDRAIFKRNFRKIHLRTEMEEMLKTETNQWKRERIQKTINWMNER